MRIAVLTAAFFLLTGLHAADAAPRVKGGLSPVFGSNEYEGWNVYLGIGGDHFSIAPEVTTYQFKGSNGRYNSASVRAGYDMRWFGFGATAGRSFPRNGYSSVYGGGDFAFTLSPLGDEGIRRIGGTGRGGVPAGKGIARVDFGGGVKWTAHRQESATTSDAKLTQRELHGFVGASVLGAVLVSGRVSKFGYNADLRSAATAVPGSFWTPLVGHMNSVNGFADSSFHANAEIPVFPMIRPFANYTYTKYAALAATAPGDSRAYAAGVRVGLELVAIEAAYQHVSVTGSAADQNFYTISAGLRL
ncbi:MAG: hypothetical protein AUJ52_05990 [Elusimicrobia bacterium CG1_02_63_36]|nr:MAG: hypothetical protein AUJ52_05990 [Elusimicrobia bacterium CG1_02_63_36]